MTKVVALEPLTGSYPVAKGEAPDFTQKESRVVGELGETVLVSVGYRGVKVLLALERLATPGDLQDDAARVASGKASRVVRGPKGPLLLLPGSVTIGGQTIEADEPGENPTFDLPEPVAKAWAERGLVKIIGEGAAVPADPGVPPAADPRLVAKPRKLAPAS